MKAGYAGEDTPKAVFPSTVGWLAKDQESAGKKDGGDVEMKDAGDGKTYFVNDMSYRRDHMELASPFNDEGLLDAVCTRVVEVHGGGLLDFAGNYTEFVAKRDAWAEAQARAAKRQRRERERMEGFISRFGAKATKATQAKTKFT